MAAHRLTLLGDALVRVIESREFRSRLAEAGRVTMRTGHETLFGAFECENDRNPVWTPVFEGGVDSVARAPYLDWPRLRYDTADRFHVETLSCHYHPQALGALGLSYDDLRQVMLQNGGRDIRPVVGIATIDPARTGNLLLLRREFDTGRSYAATDSVIDQIWDRYQAAETEEWPSDAVLHALRLPGFVKAEVFAFWVPPSGSAHLPEAQRPALVSFAGL